MTIGVNIYQTTACGQVVAVMPRVDIHIDIEENYDINALRTFKSQLEEFIDKGLNKAIVDRGVCCHEHIHRTHW